MITMARKAAILPALLATFSAGPLRAGDRACSSPTVAMDGEVRARWPDLAARVEGAFDGRADVDACARIALRANRASIVVDVVLMDGRATSRSVSRADDVVPTLEALLLLPAAGAPTPPPEPARAGTPAVAAAPAGTTEARPTDSKPIVATESRLASAVAHDDRGLRLEFSLVTGARAGAGQVGVGLGALTLFDAGGWLAGFGAAGRGYQGVTGGPTATSLELAIVAGRRFRFGSIALDLTAGPLIAVRGFGHSVVSRTADGSGGAAMPPPVDDGPWTRVIGGARVTFRARSVVRTFAGLEGDVALERSTAALPAGEPRLPAWTAGVVLGATVGTP